MHERALHDKSAFRFQKFNDFLVGVFHILALEVSHFNRVAPSIINRAWRELIWIDDTIRDSNTMVIFPESRGLVYDAGSISCSDIFVSNDPESPVLILEHATVSNKSFKPAIN